MPQNSQKNNLLFHHVAEQKVRNHSNCNALTGLVDNFGDFTIGQSNHVLAIHLPKKVDLQINSLMNDGNYQMLTSSKLCSIKSPFLAAEESTTIAVILPSLN